jgi:bifunctional non-homologous end joining protein LigD
MLKDGKDLRSVREETRIKEGMLIADLLNDPSFEMIPVAYTEQEKRDLVKKQQAEGREGEIWVQKGCKYKGGKDTKTYPIVRTKYLEEINAICTGVTNTTAEGRLFGAMIVAEEIGGEMVELGRVGTGFSYEQQVQIMDKLNKGPFPVKIISQGRTTAGKVWHGRFDGFIN